MANINFKIGNTWTSIYDIIYPIGSIYLCNGKEGSLTPAGTASPASLFGGTWVKKDNSNTNISYGRTLQDKNYYYDNGSVNVPKNTVITITVPSYYSTTSVEFLTNTWDDYDETYEWHTFNKTTSSSPSAGYYYLNNTTLKVNIPSSWVPFDEPWSYSGGGGSGAGYKVAFRYKAYEDVYTYCYIRTA